MGLEDTINIEQIPEENFELSKFVKEVEENLYESGTLFSGKFPGGVSEGKFDSGLWVVENEYVKGYSYINFDDLYKLKFKNVKEEDILIIRCWLAEFFIWGYKPYWIPRKYSDLVNFIDITSNFSKGFLEENKGNDMSFLKVDKSDRSAKVALEHVLSYINYRNNLGLPVNDDTTNEYIVGLENLAGNLNVDESPRELPKNKDALLFEYYLGKFFDDKWFPEELKVYYMPVLIWWKVSTVIPLRPTEICTKMVRECIAKINNKTYLKIKRIKHSSIVSNTAKRALLPILDKLEITDKIQKLIEDYVNLTDEFGHTETLFSYIATEKLRKRLNEIDKVEYSFLSPTETMKLNKEFFTSRTLNYMIKSFYKSIIKGFYKDDSIEECLMAGDTRHYAFTYLLLSGLTPVEIALIGGHSTLNMQDNYQCNAKYFIDQEVFDFAMNSKEKTGFTNKNIKKIVFNMPKECPRPLEDCISTIEGIGYCTADIKNEGLLCDGYCYCFECEKWWCAPTEYNYDMLRKYIKVNCIAPLEKKLEAEQKYLQSIINQMNTNNLDGYQRADVNDERKFNKLRVEFKGNIDRMIDLKKLLLDLTSNKNELILGDE